MSEAENPTDAEQIGCEFENIFDESPFVCTERKDGTLGISENYAYLNISQETDGKTAGAVSTF